LESGGNLVALRGFVSAGYVVVTGVFLLPVDDLLQALPEFLQRFALVRKNQKPQPFSRSRFLNKQLACAWRFHCPPSFCTPSGCSARFPLL